MKILFLPGPPAAGALAILAMLVQSAATADVPESVAAINEKAVATVHAEGAQVYECQRDSRGQLAWQFREPIATLIVDGKTVGRHFAGPGWEMMDGSAVTGKVIARAASANPANVPLLKLEVTSERGAGKLSGITTIQRLNTNGGALDGSCMTPGALASVPYSADYTFLQRAD